MKFCYMLYYKYILILLKWDTLFHGIYIKQIYQHQNITACQFIYNTISKYINYVHRHMR